jgi:hypothetical protein
MSQEEYERVKKEVELIKEEYIKPGKLTIKEKANSLPEMRLWIRKMKPDIVVIDTIQGIEMPEGEVNINPAFGIPVILKGLKTIAKQTNCAVILVAWMSTEGKRPKTWMMYASKAMDRWSSKIWMLYYYYKVDQIKAFKNIVEVINGKERFNEGKINILSVKPEYGIFDKAEIDELIKKQYKDVTKLRA